MRASRGGHEFHEAWAVRMSLRLVMHLEVNVRVSSAFVAASDAEEIAIKLANQDGFRASLPFDEYDPRDRSYEEKKPRTTEFVTRASCELDIDESDPLGAGVAMWRPMLVNKINSWAGLRPTDAFRRAWAEPTGKVVCRSEAWGSSEKNYEGSNDAGTRLTCTLDFLKKLLSHEKRDLPILVLLRKCTRGYGGESSRYWHSTAVIHLTKALKQTFYPGLANVEHKSEY